MTNPISSDFAKELLAGKQTRVSTGSSRVTDYPTKAERTYQNWFRLFHRLDNCTDPNCPDVRERKVAEGTAMCATVNGHVMCRLSFLAGYATSD